MTHYPHVIGLALDEPWAILPDKLAQIRLFLEAKSQGIHFTPEEIAARVGTRRSTEAAPAPPSNVAVIPVYGVVGQRLNMMQAISGGTSTERIAAELRTALDDASVKAIMLDVDSPGGSTFGVQELADEIYRGRGRKPIVAQVNSLAASAAYWIATAASEVVMTPGGLVGSIGVYALHEDASRLLDKTGLKMTFVSAGEHKVEGNSFEPLTAEARAAIQARVSTVYDRFVGSVARGRGVSATKVKAEFGKGRVVQAREALAAGMVDRIGTYQETLARLVGSSRPASAPKGSAALAVGTSASADDWRRRRHAHRLRSP